MSRGSFINILKTGSFIVRLKQALGQITVKGASPEGEFSGRTTYCQCLNSNNQPMNGDWSLTSGYQYATINQYGRIDVYSGISNKSITIAFSSNEGTVTKTLSVSYDNQLDIEGPDSIFGEYGNVVAKFNGTIVTPTWSIVSGGSNATISNDGTITVLDSGDITVQATYSNVTTRKTISVGYVDDTYSKTLVSPDGKIITIQTVEETQNQDGSTTTNTSGRSMDENGDTSTTETTTTEYQNGSSTTTSTTTNSDGTSVDTTSQTSAPNQSGTRTTQTISTYYNENGVETGRCETQEETNSDGSSTSTSTYYDTNNDPTHQVVLSIDEYGNISTQEIDYNSNGDQIVSKYSIDTTNNDQTNAKTFNANGVNTQFYCFDPLDGFVMDLHFTMDITNQPANQEGNHHNIFTMKRSSPEPWYGFQMRQTGNAKNVVFGIQFESGSGKNYNTQIGTNWLVPNTVLEYDFHITYDPTISTSKFVCRELKTDTTIPYDKTFPNDDSLRYLKACIGFAQNSDGNPYRFSNINVINFKIEKLSKASQEQVPSMPEFTLENNTLTITCETENAQIWYKINGASTYTLYTTPIGITQDTIVQAYSKLNDTTSQITSQMVTYQDSLRPIIKCDGEWVQIQYKNPNADIYYRIGTTDAFSQYESEFQISNTVIVEAYAIDNGQQTETTTQTCTYAPIVLANPRIACNDNMVSIGCFTPRSTIYYRIGDSGSFTAYDGAFFINENTSVQAYSTYKSQTSEITQKTCTYESELAHDYSGDYFTIKARTNGNIKWFNYGRLAQTLEYKINNGEWTSLFQGANTNTIIPVLQNDKIMFRGQATALANSDGQECRFKALDDASCAEFDVEGNIMSLLYKDDFANAITFPDASYIFNGIFKNSKVVSAKNLILPATTLKAACYRSMFNGCSLLVEAPQLPATTLKNLCYYHMFKDCTSLTKAPILNAYKLDEKSFYQMFSGCSSLDTIECHATTNINETNLNSWTQNVASKGVFIKSSEANWTLGTSGIPEGWIVCDDYIVAAPMFSYDYETCELSCSTQGATIYYRIGTTGNFHTYSTPISINATTTIQAYASYIGYDSQIASYVCEYAQQTPLDMSNKAIASWSHKQRSVETPYSVNQIDGHSPSYAKGEFAFETAINLRQAQPTYLWFQHADQSADIYVDNLKVGTHWGGYNAFFFDITNYVHRGTNTIKVVLCNTSRDTLAPASGDFNFNATLGNVKLFTSPCLPDMKYGYDGFHITSTVTSSSATVYVKTTVPSGATLVCTISDGTYEWTETKTSNGLEQTFQTTITGSDLRLWNGKSDPHLYNVKLEIYKDNELYHRYERPYGLRYYSYVINQTVNGSTYTGFLLNGQPYLLRGVCMHDDLAGKANALNDADYAQEFAIIQELGCNFIRLAHYPHPKEVYDWCDRLGIIVQTEVPCVNKLQSTMPEDYYTHLETQYRDMVEQHYNHPCIMFWGLGNEAVVNDSTFAKTKLEGYYNLIKSMDSERMVGIVGANLPNPSAYYGNPNLDWFGSNIYVGWYTNTSSNNPSSHINDCINFTIVNKSKAWAFSEHGAGGTQRCHSDEFMNTTNAGSNGARHDIEYQMWLHEGHLAAIRNYPQLIFTSAWQLFDIAVTNRYEGYTECLDGVNATTNEQLTRLNDKGLVERDHITKKDTFYLYKAEWNSTDKFVHICGKSYTKNLARVLKCYTNDGNTLSLYEGSNETPLETVQVSDHIAQFSSRDFTSGVTYTVRGNNTFDTITFAS